MATIKNRNNISSNEDQNMNKKLKTNAEKMGRTQ